MNRVTLCGFVRGFSKHPTTLSGTEIRRFLLTTIRRYKHGKEWRDRTESHSCVLYGNSVNVSDNALQKGSHLLIEGELAYRQYDRRIETNSGPVNVKWPIAEIIVHSIAALDRQNNGGAAA